MNYELDLTAYRCPLPLLMTKKALLELQQGDELNVWLSSDNGSGDLEAYCRKQDYPLHKQEIDGKICLKITKSA